jgi:Secretion system C-terminal sorting domain
MKKIILIFYCFLLCPLSWGQDSYLAEAVKSKGQEGPVSTRAPEEEAKKISLFPNPSNGIVHLTLAGFKGKRTEVRILNVIGNVVYREILTDLEDRFTKTIDLSKSANGLYYVKLQTEDFSEVRKIILD